MPLFEKAKGQSMPVIVNCYAEGAASRAICWWYMRSMTTRLPAVIPEYDGDPRCVGGEFLAGGELARIPNGPDDSWGGARSG